MPSTPTTYHLNLPDQPKEIHAGHLRQGGLSPYGDSLDVNNYYITLNGRPFFGVSGEFQFSRYPHPYWEDELRKIKATGVNILATYLFWNHHEPIMGQFNWQGSNDVRHFVQLCQKVGLWVAARIGPFAHGECRNGGLPDWLYGQPYEVRSNHPDYLAYVARYFNEIGRQLSGLWFSQGGPILAMQLDNEYMHTGAPWEAADRSQGMEWLTAGKEGVSHLLELRELARQAGMEAPLLTFTAWGSPIIPQESLPMYGGYAYPVWVAQEFPSDLFTFRDLHATVTEPYQYPVVNAEMQGGIQVRYTNRPVVPPRSTEALALVKVGSGSNYLGYYIYHGGSNPLINGVFPNEINHPQVSYDFQAPIGEYGEVRPAARYLKLLHLFLQAFGADLAPMGTALPSGWEAIQPADGKPLRFCARHKSGSGFLFLNNFQDHVDLPAQGNFRLELELDGHKLVIPASEAKTSNGLTLPPGVCCIWAFNLDLAGAQLRYATAQPLTVLIANGEAHYFFFAVEGIPAEYALNPQTLSGLSGDVGESLLLEDTLLVRPQPGLERSITFTSQDGRVVRITTLTRQEAEHAWRGFAWGSERLIISDADPFFVEGGVELRLAGASEAQLSVFPAVDALPAGRGVTIQRLEGNAGSSPFSTFQLAVPERSPSFHLEQYSQYKFLLSFPADLMDGCEDVFLHIEYDGDTCGAYIHGRLAADNYNNGTPWSLGLKRFLPELLQNGLLLKFRPLHRGALKNISSPMASRAVFEGEELLNLKDIHLAAEYAIRLTGIGIK